MASPPFNINQALPGDSDIVSQHPSNARTFRDIVESWLLIDHNNLGQHAKVTMPWAAAPSAPAASLAIVFVDTNGDIKVIDASKEFYLGPPPGSVFFSASSTLDNGYLRPDGSAVSRSVFAALFAKIGLTYGAGDGTTTFNLPDIKGRYIAGVDSGASRITSTYFGTSAVLAAVGGLQSSTLINDNLPPYSPAGTMTVPIQGFYDLLAGSGPAPGGNPINISAAFGVNNAVQQFITRTITGSPQGGLSTPVRTIPPTIILNPMIKY